MKVAHEGLKVEEFPPAAQLLVGDLHVVDENVRRIVEPVISSYWPHGSIDSSEPSAPDW